MKQKCLMSLIVFSLLLIPFAAAQSNEYPQITEQFCDAVNPCSEGLECYSFPNIGLRCAEKNPCDYYECPESTQCLIAESYPAQVKCSCVGPECTSTSSDEDTVSISVVSNYECSENSRLATQFDDETKTYYLGTGDESQGLSRFKVFTHVEVEDSWASFKVNGEFGDKGQHFIEEWGNPLFEGQNIIINELKIFVKDIGYEDDFEYVSFCYGLGENEISTAEHPVTNSDEVTVSYDLSTQTVIHTVKPNEQAVSHKISLKTTSGNKGIFETAETSVEYSNELFVEDSELFMKTSAGKKKINTMPEEAIKVSETPVSEIVLKEESEMPIYSINGEKTGKLFGVFPVRMRIRTKVSAETGDVISVNKPWWGFLAKE